MRNAFGMMYEWSGVFPPYCVGGEMLHPVIADPTLLAPALQPEAGGELIASRRSGRYVYIDQDLTGLGRLNVSGAQVVPRSWKPAVNSSIADVYANILSSPDVPGLR